MYNVKTHFKTARNSDLAWKARQIPPKNAIRGALKNEHLLSCSNKVKYEIEKKPDTRLIFDLTADQSVKWSKVKKKN